LQLAVESEDAPGKAAAAADELARDADLYRPIRAAQAAGDTVEPDAAIEATRRDDELRIKVV
jgi:hypothetical protein